MTRDALGQYNKMIRETTADLEADLNIKRLMGQRQSVQQCLLICNSVKSHIQTLQENLQPLDAKPNQDRRQTAVAFSEARDGAMLMDTDLQKWLFDLSVKSAKQCLEVCKMAAEQASEQRVHILSDVSTEDYSQQIIVTTVEDLINAKDNAKNEKVGSFSV